MRFTAVWHQRSLLTFIELSLFGEKIARRISVSDVSNTVYNKVADHAKLVRLVVKLHKLIKHKLTLRKSQFYLDIREKFLTAKS